MNETTNNMFSPTTTLLQKTEVPRQHIYKKIDVNELSLPLQLYMW